MTLFLWMKEVDFDLILRLYELYKLSGKKTNNEIDEMHLKLTKKK